MGKVLAFINQKGGVGKTTSAVNVGLSLAVSEIKTLIVDLDPQANATIGLSDLTEKSEKNIYDVLINNENISEAISKTTFPCLDVVSSTNDLVGAEVELVNIMAREYQLKTALKKVVRKYDVIILDCPPSLGLLTINAFNISQFDNHVRAVCGLSIEKIEKSHDRLSESKYSQHRARSPEVGFGEDSHVF